MKRFDISARRIPDGGEGTRWVSHKHRNCLLGIGKAQLSSELSRRVVFEDHVMV